jgi:flagellar basal-body rod modification protein FlgD
METSAITPAGQGSTSTETNQALRGLEMDDFLRLMITELQNQDPLDPMENSEILQQISQIREIEATSSLSETLEAVLRGQNLSSAASLIGREVTALADDGATVTGAVERVSVDADQVLLHVGDRTVSLENVRTISTT